MDENATQEPSAKGKIAVIGGGLAGLSAACELADGGYQVTLLERRPYLGGRSYSFFDRKLGAEVDNGQHVFMRCCTYYMAFLRKLGVFDRTHLQERLDVKVVGEEGRQAALASSRLPAPLHLLPSLLRYRHLSWRDRVGVLYASLALLTISLRKRSELDHLSFHDWLTAHRQSPRAIEAFWNFIVLPALNDDVWRVSAAQAVMLFQVSFLKDSHGADIGYSTVGLSSLMAQEAQQYIQGRHGSVLLGKSVAQLEGAEDGIEGVRVHGGGTLQTDRYILAVPSHELLGLLPPSLRRHDFFSRAGLLGSSPIVNLHLWLDRKVTDQEFTSFLDSEIQWVFNKSRMYNLNGPEGQYLCISLSGAHKYIDMPKESLRKLFVGELGRLFPAAKGASVTQFTVVKERFATFTPAPGSAAYRLPARTPVPNLFLAGAWTDTGWPATMESAVRSGVICAQAIMGTP